MSKQILVPVIFIFYFLKKIVAFLTQKKKLGTFWGKIKIYSKLEFFFSVLVGENP
jgi:hypothetical protein